MATKSTLRGAPPKEPRKPTRQQQAREQAAANAAGLGDVVVPEMPLWGSFIRIGGSLTPAEVSQIMRSADIGRPYQLVDLAHECRQKDGHLQSILGTRENSLTRLPWAVVPRSDEPRRVELKRAVQCQEALSRVAGMRDALAHLVGESAMFGHATIEIVWRMAVPEDGPLLRGLLIPNAALRVSSRRFGFRLSDGALLYDPFTEYGGSGDVGATGADLVAENPPGKFVQVTRRMNGDVMAREGLCRVLVWAALFRNWGLRDWLTAAEIAWKPWRVGKFKKAAAPEDIELLKRVLARMSSSGVAAIPETVDLSVEWPKGATSGSQSLHRELCEFLAGEMSKAVLGQTMTTEAGMRGARSLGETQADASLRPIIETDAEIVGGFLTQQLIEPFYALNFGVSDGARWVFQTEDRQNTESFAKAVKTLREAGLALQASWVRDQLGIPPPKPEEELLGGATTDEDGKAPEDRGDTEGGADDQEPSDEPGDAADEDGSDDGKAEAD